MTNYQMALKAETILDDNLPRLVRLAQKGLPFERLAASIKNEISNCMNPSQATFSWMEVKAACIEAAGIDEAKFTKRGRHFLPKTARQIFAFICYKNGLLSLSEMGEVCGGYDHTTMLHGRDKVRDLLSTGDDRMTNFYNDVMEILNR